MNINTGRAPVGNSQKVGGNQKPTDPKRAFSVNWKKNAATIGEVVRIDGVAHITIANPALVSVKILLDGKPYVSAEKVEIKNNGQIAAEWKIVPAQFGNYTSGRYDVEIRYGGGQYGITPTPLKIVAGSAAYSGVSSFG